MARSHQGCTEEGMEKIDLAVRVLLSRAARAVDFARPEVLGPVECYQHPAIQTPECRQPIRSLGCGAVQHLPDMVIARYLLHAEQGLAVRASPARRQHLLMRKKRRALHEKHRERRHPDVRHRVGAVRSCGDDPSGWRRPLSVPSAGFPVFSCHRRTTSRFPDASPVSAPSQRVASQ